MYGWIHRPGACRCTVWTILPHHQQCSSGPHSCQHLTIAIILQSTLAFCFSAFYPVGNQFSPTQCEVGFKMFYFSFGCSCSSALSSEIFVCECHVYIIPIFPSNPFWVSLPQNLWPLYYCYIYMHVYMYINMHTCIYNLLSSFNVAHMWMCPGLRLGIWHPGSELIHGRNCSLSQSLWPLLLLL